MKHKNILLLLLLVLPAMLQAQQLVVFSVSGSPQKMEGTDYVPLKVWDVLTPSTTIKIPDNASIDVIDKEAGRQYHIKTPGNNRLQSFLSDQQNGVKQLSQRDLQYLSEQIEEGMKRSARRNDAAVVTNDAKSNDAEEDPWDVSAWEREFEEFTKNATEEYESFRASANQQYADFMAEAWKTFGVKQPIPKPKDFEAKPMVIPPYDQKLKIESRPIKIENVVIPAIPTPQPLPIEPIMQDEEVVVVEPLPLLAKIPGINPVDMPVDEPLHKPSLDRSQLNPLDVNIDESVVGVEPPPSLPTVLSGIDPVDMPIDESLQKPSLDRSQLNPLDVYINKPVGHEVLFYGTKVYVRFRDECSFHLPSLSEADIAELWKSLSSDIYNNTIADCLNIRTQLQLSDWAYLMLLQRVGETLMGKGTNEATLLSAYIYCQSGYKMRLAKTPARLMMLFASRHLVYNLSYWIIDGEYFYPLNPGNETQISICTLPFPEEQSLSLLLTQEQVLAINDTPVRRLESKVAPAMSVEISVNRNLLDFYDGYPVSEIGDNVMTRWAMYANTPLASDVREALYPSLKEQLQGLSRYEAVGKLLSFVQHALVYELDDVVWGYDRAFFAEETLFYPYADCEDRSILFSRLVRDLLGLKVALVYYPGHLATAVNFDENVAGDYLTIDGMRFVICDPTYIGAAIGRTMPKMDNASATVMVLEN